MKSFIEKIKKQNKGFSVISVIIVIAFIGIMAMIVLYISMSNFYMKVTDLKAKDSFYTAENALDEIRAGLQEVVGEAMTDAYVEVLEKYNEGGGSGESLDKIRQNAFKKQYIDNLKTRLEKKGAENEYDLSVIESYVDLADAIDSNKESLKIVNIQDKDPVLECPNTASDTIEQIEKGVRLRNLKVVYVDPLGRASIIETDIRLGMPRVNFPTPSTLPDLMNMIVVANKGIVLGSEEAAENSGKPITIRGSVYAGHEIGENDPISLLIRQNQVVNLDSGKRFVCLGEIHAKDGSEFHNNGSVDLWAQGLVAESAKVELSGKTYFGDDLTLSTKTNWSTGSTVRISGEYYGFGSPASAAGSHFSDNKYIESTNASNAAKNSSIIVNGKGSTLDLSGVTKLMLAGNSYVGSRKVDPGAYVGNNKNTADVLTGESITVKGNQLAYLVPSECFKDSQELFLDGGKKVLTNPMDYDTYADLVDSDGIFDMDKPVDAWGGKTMNQLGLDGASPVQKVFYSTVGGGYVYFYLNFTEPAKASEYFAQYYNNPAVKANMDQYLDFYLGGEGNGILMRDKNAFLRFVTNGNVLSFPDGQGNLIEKSGINAEQEQTNLQNMWFSLTRKMITSYDLLKEVVKRPDGTGVHNEKDAGRYVFDNLVDEEGLKEFLNGQTQYEFTSENSSLKAYVVDGDFPIDDTIAADTRLVVATGDVTIGKGVSFKGIIMTKGKLYMETGSSLTSEPLEAAKVFKAQRESEGETVPMDFFWDGDKYVLGNSMSENENPGEMKEDSVYDISECITYEHWVKK